MIIYNKYIINYTKMFRNVISKFRIKYLFPLKDRFGIDNTKTVNNILIYSIMEGNHPIIRLIRNYRNDKYSNTDNYHRKIRPIDDPKIKTILSESLINVCLNGHHDLETIQRLIDKGADPSYNDSYALRRCCNHNEHIAIVKILLKNGADISNCNYEALLNASKAGYLMTNILIDHMFGSY